MTLSPVSSNLQSLQTLSAQSQRIAHTIATATVPRTANAPLEPDIDTALVELKGVALAYTAQLKFIQADEALKGTLLDVVR